MVKWILKFLFGDYDMEPLDLGDSSIHDPNHYDI